MGTSRSAPAPKGGNWRKAKAAITRHLNGTRPLSSTKPLIDAVVTAGGGFGVGGGGGGSSGLARGFGGAISSLGGFGAAVAKGGLAAGLAALGLPDLTGKPPVEVIGAVSEHISSTCDGPDGDILRNALLKGLHEAANLDQEGTYKKLDDALQDFVQREGIEGLVGAFLNQFVFDIIWVNIEALIDARTVNEVAFETFMISVQGRCRAEVRNEISAAKRANTFQKLNWFGKDGLRIGRSIAKSIQSRFQTDGQS